jgi:choline-glycine betaine transporter
MQHPHRLSNTVIGYLNLLTLVASIPIIGAGLWLAHGSTCESALQAPLLAIGFIVLLVSLAGFIGGCYHVTCALWLYLLAVLLLVVALLGVTVFGLAVTAGGGGGRPVPGRPYREFRVTDYSAWLQRHVEAEQYWRAALACVVGSRACSKIATWTPLDYLQHNLTPIQV